MVWKEIRQDVHDFASEIQIEGVLVDRKESKHSEKDDKKYDYLIEKNPGDIVLVFGSTVLDGKMSLVKVGDLVKIEYLGMKKNKHKVDYHDYKVSVDVPHSTR